MLESLKNPQKLGGGEKKGRKKSELLLCMEFFKKRGLEFQTLCGKFSNLGIKFLKKSFWSI